VNDRKHFPTEMGGVTSPTSASSQRAGTVLSALPAARNEPQGTSQHGPRADCRHPIPADRRTPRRQLGRNKAGCRSVGRGTALESQNAELCEVGQLLHLRCEQVAALSRKVKMPSPPRTRFANELDDFVAYMASEQGLSPISIRSHRWKTSKFLNGSRIGIGSCRRPLWMMLMSSLHSKRTTAGIANRFPLRLRLCAHSSVTRSAAVGARQE